MTRAGLLFLLFPGVMLLRAPAVAGENHPPRKPQPEHATAARAHPQPPVTPATPAPVQGATPGAPRACAVPTAPGLGAVVVGCRLDAHPFRGLAAGVVDYCRGHLGYAPGAPDCYAFADEVCTVYLPANDAWTETRRTLSGEPFPCPDAPEPPVCPRLTWR